VDYDERLAVPGWWWAAAGGLVVLLGAEVYAGFGWAGAVITYAVLGALVALALRRMSRVRLVVHDGQLAVGRHRLPLAEVTAVRALDNDARRTRMGPASDTRAVIVTRPWIDTAVELTRAADDVPYWLVSTRRPDALVAVVRQACGAPSQHGSM
jgi:hypothetical protein